nr:uncharacterized mitochondrial protein AtMg00810-like [Tanacetum cinerariifolium]
MRRYMSINLSVLWILNIPRRRGTIDKTLFLKKNKRDIILVQVYVDDIIFGSTKKAWCDEFEALMKGEFQLSAMGELTFFLGLQVKQRPDGMFISQDKYVQEILNKFDLGSVRTATTPYEAPKPKSKNEYDSPVYVHLYRSIIGSRMNLTALRPDIMFAVSACSRNQVTPTTSNLEEVKKIFKYLKGQPKLAYGILENRRLISWQCKKQTIVATSSIEAEYVADANCYGQLNFEGHHMLLLAAMLSQDQEGEGAGHGQSSDPNIASFLQTHETDDDPSSNVEDEPLGGSFHMSPPRSTQAPPADSLETELKDHKKLFKDVVGKLVKKVKAMKPDVDLDALLALANAAVTIDSNIPPGGASNNPAASTSVPANVPTSANVPTDSTSVPADVPTSVAPACISNKEKTLMVEEDITVKERTFKQMKDDRLDNFPARMAALIKRKKQALAEKLAKERKDRPMTQGQQRTYMRKFVKNQSCAVYSTRWSMAKVKSFTDDQLKEEFEKIQKALSNIQIQAFSRTLKMSGLVLEKPSSKRQKSTEASIPSVPEVPP